MKSKAKMIKMVIDSIDNDINNWYEAYDYNYKSQSYGDLQIKVNSEDILCKVIIYMKDRQEKFTVTPFSTLFWKIMKLIWIKSKEENDIKETKLSKSLDETIKENPEIFKEVK